jgi:hypothetical protein
MTKPLVLTEQEVEILVAMIRQMGKYAIPADQYPRRQATIEECVRMLTSPRTEAFGLKKQQLEKLGRICWNELPEDQYRMANHVFQKIASGLDNVVSTTQV